VLLDLIFRDVYDFPNRVRARNLLYLLRFLGALLQFARHPLEDCPECASPLLLRLLRSSKLSFIDPEVPFGFVHFRDSEKACPFLIGSSFRNSNIFHYLTLDCRTLVPRFVAFSHLQPIRNPAMVPKTRKPSFDT